tara:strand:+ start:852 stop:1166 length:315 start_codon:yes stop_codon:yes gene_type:complete
LFSSTSTLALIFDDLHRDQIKDGDGDIHNLKSAESKGAIIDQNLFSVPITDLVNMGLSTFRLSCSYSVSVEEPPEEPVAIKPNAFTVLMQRAKGLKRKLPPKRM